jgi:hypothetical protein
MRLHRTIQAWQRLFQRDWRTQSRCAECSNLGQDYLSEQEANLDCAPESTCPVKPLPLPAPAGARPSQTVSAATQRHAAASSSAAALRQQGYTTSGAPSVPLTVLQPGFIHVPQQPSAPAPPPPRPVPPDQLAGANLSPQGAGHHEKTTASVVKQTFSGVATKIAPHAAAAAGAAAATAGRLAAKAAAAAAAAGEPPPRPFLHHQYPGPKHTAERPTAASHSASSATRAKAAAGSLASGYLPVASLFPWLFAFLFAGVCRDSRGTCQM